MVKKMKPQPAICKCCNQPLTEDTNHDEKLRIGIHEKRFFPHRNFYNNYMEKIVWEEDD
jgi:hypothetical protein